MLHDVGIAPQGWIWLDGLSDGPGVIVGTVHLALPPLDGAGGDSEELGRLVGGEAQEAFDPQDTESRKGRVVGTLPVGAGGTRRGRPR